MKRIFKTGRKTLLVLLTAMLALGSVSFLQLDRAYAAAYTLRIIGGSGSGSGVNVQSGGAGVWVEEGSIITVTAAAPPSGQMFDRWNVTHPGLTSPSSLNISSVIEDQANSTTKIKMPAANVTLEALYKNASGYRLTVTDGTITIKKNGGSSQIASGSYVEYNTEVTITANPAAMGKTFDKWTGTYSNLLKEEKAATTTFTMPRSEVSFTATYLGGTHALTAVSSTFSVDGKAVASGTAVNSGKIVTVTADPAPTGKVFDKWTSNSTSLAFADAAATTTTFTMPDSALTVTATYKDVAVQPKTQIITFLMGSQTYFVDLAGQKEAKMMEAAPFIQDGRTMLPLRYAGEALGAQIAWNPETRQASCTLEGTTVIVTLGSKTMLVGGQTMEMDVAPVIVAGRTFLPVKWIAVALGFDATSPLYKEGNAVNWDAATKAVSIHKIVK